MNTLSLYIHIPWCKRKCPYCDFCSFPLSEKNDPFHAYANALRSEIQKHARTFSGREIASIYIGGGTPSLMPAGLLAALLAEIHSEFTPSPDIEITIECNPGTVSEGIFEQYLDAGINRLSIGAQSFNDNMLKKIERIHDARSIAKTVTLARISGFQNINLDIMYGLPDQSGDAALSDLQQALSLAPEHLSWYELTPEPDANNAWFEQQALPDIDEKMDILSAGQALLAAHGYQQYEISAYAAENKTCQHNLHYWRFEDYLGLGVGAHSKFQTRTHQTYRAWHSESVVDYLKAPTDTEQVLLSDNDLLSEFMLNVLRLKRPIPFAWFLLQTGLPEKMLRDRIASIQRPDLIQTSADAFTLTQKGWDFMNDVVMLFL